MNTESNTTNPNPTNDGRDAGGQFAKGNKGGPGNPFARQVAGFRKAFIDAGTSQDMHEMAAALMAKAKQGDVPAAKLVLSYLIGKPQPAPDPDHLDADEWNVYREQAPMKEESAAMINAGVPEFHLDCVRKVRPVVTMAMKMQLDALARETPEQHEAREAALAAQAKRMMNKPVETPDFLKNRPSPNRDNGTAPPSANGDSGAPPPSANGKKRPSKPAADRLQPSTNGVLHPADAR